MGTWVNWLLLIGGLVCVIAELAMGAATGFDLALIGCSLAAGGAIGLLFHSGNTGLIAAGVLGFAYLAFLRRWLRSKLTSKTHAMNVDAVVGKTALVIKRIAPLDPGQVKLGDEVWRAELLQTEDAPREPGARVIVDSVEGVTLKVR
ncbi:MAG: hypothetical protein LAN71_04380 [Acidobacteriia bacterium]|nr:hypothetical protein [Terriglobia bacterium]